MMGDPGAPGLPQDLKPDHFDHPINPTNASVQPFGIFAVATEDFRRSWRGLCAGWVAHKFNDPRAAGGAHDFS